MLRRVLAVFALLVAGCGARSDLDAAAGEGVSTAGSAGSSTSTSTSGDGASSGTIDTWSNSCVYLGQSCGVDADCCAGICAAGKCDDAACKPGEGPVVLADGQMGPDTLALDVHRVYWTDHDPGSSGRVMHVFKKGGSLEVVAAAQSRPRGIAVNSSHVYWTDALAGTVQRAPKGDGEPVLLASSQQFPGPLVLWRLSEVYWTDNGTVGNGSVMAYLSGGPAKTLAADLSLPWGIAVDDTHVYWANQESPGSGPGTLMSLPLDGSGPPVLLVTGLASPEALVADDSRLYWASNAGVFSVDKGGGDVTPIAPDTFARGVAVDDTSVYWADGFDGTVRKAPKSGGKATVLASGQLRPTGVRVDETCVYWANGTSAQFANDGVIMKAPK